jgi:hypothetical protein
MKNSESYSFYVKAVFFGLGVLNIFFVLYQVIETFCKPIYIWLTKRNTLFLIGIILFSLCFFVDWFWMKRLGIPIDVRVWPIAVLVLIFSGMTIKALFLRVKNKKCKK